MKKLLLSSALVLSTFTFANTIDSNTNSNTLNESVKVESNVNDVSTAQVKPVLLRAWYTIKFPIDCGNGTSGVMTATFPSDNVGIDLFLDVIGIIAQGTVEGCKKLGENGL